MPSTKRPVRYGLIALVLYLLSLPLPAIIEIHKPLLWGSPHDELMYGFQCLLIGWITIPWYANVALWIASIALALRRPGLAAVFAFLAIGLAQTLFLYIGTYVRSPHAGYFLWLGSMIVMFFGAYADHRRRRAALAAL